MRYIGPSHAQKTISSSAKGRLLFHERIYSFWPTCSPQYNQPDSEVYEHAQAVERAFERRYGELYPGTGAEDQVEK